MKSWGLSLLTVSKTRRYSHYRPAFTIVELLVVIVVIGILAAITITTYTGITQKAVVSTIQSDLTNASRQLMLFNAEKSILPATIDCSQPDSAINKCIKSSDGILYEYSPNISTIPFGYCIAAIKNNISYKIINDDKPISGSCGDFGLVQYLDAGDSSSYSGTGDNWNDLSTGGNNITLLNSIGFTNENGGGIVFDGVDDYGHPLINYSYKKSSAIEIIFKSNSHGVGFKTIYGYLQPGGYSRPVAGTIYLSDNNLATTLITLSQAYRTVLASSTIQMGQYYHVVFNKNTINGLMELYINGQNQGNTTFDASTYGQWLSPGNFVGQDKMDIGKSTNTNAGQGWSNDYFNGVIPYIRLYSRVLTSIEIQQKYDSIKDRYGI